MAGEMKKTGIERTTPEQLRFFVSFVQKHPELAIGKNCPKSPNLIGELWAELATGLNAMRGPTRSSEKWKETLTQWKNQLRCRARKQKAEIKATGGGPAGAMLSDFEAQALATFGASAVDGKCDVLSMGFEIDNNVKVICVESLDIQTSSPDQSSREVTPLRDEENSSPVSRKRRAQSPLIALLKESIKRREQLEEERLKQDAERAQREDARAAETANALQTMANAITSLANALGK